MGILPADFRANIATNYTLEFVPSNFVQNMKLVVAVPKEVQFPKSTALLCHGLAGTDSPNLNCTVDGPRRLILISDAFSYQRGNPGTVRILIESLENPNENILTNSFRLVTLTSNGFLLDTVEQGLSINFFCEYPCAACDDNRKDRCLECYGGRAGFYLFSEFSCLQECPRGLTNTTTNNCTACETPCATCSIAPSFCTECVSGFIVVGDAGYCREVVYWPFPFVLLGLAAFIVILTSEIVTKTESRFKEAFIAMLSLPEIAAWTTLLLLMVVRLGVENLSTILAGTALLCSVIINLIHAWFYPRNIVPKALPNYKVLFVKHKCSTYAVVTASYIFSFKFSLMLVSYFWVHPRYSGDYSSVAWTYFNRFSFLFLVVPFPLMMIACVNLL